MIALEMPVQLDEPSIISIRLAHAYFYLGYIYQDYRVVEAEKMCF